MPRRRHDHDDTDVPAETFIRGSSADWPDPADDPDTEPVHPARIFGDEPELEP
jgi:hypothetical protein